MFFIMFFIFVGIGYFLFGLSVKEYKSFFSVIGSLINIFIGVNSFDVLVELNFVVVRMFYFMYIFLVIMILFIIFVVILNKSIIDVKEESVGVVEIVGVMDIVLKFVKLVLVFVFFVGKNNVVDKKNENWGKYYLFSIFFMNLFYVFDLFFNLFIYSRVMFLKYKILIDLIWDKLLRFILNY